MGVKGLPTIGRRKAAHVFRRLTVGPFLLVPGLVLVALLLGYPLLDIVLRSLSPTGGESLLHPQFSAQNYIDLFQDPVALIILRNTFVVALVASLVSVCIAFPVAMFMSQVPSRLARTALVLVLFPLWTSVVVRMYSLQLILGQAKVLYTQTAVIIGMSSYLVPFLIMILYSGMSRVDANLLTAARTLGARPSRVIFLIFLPLTRSAVFAGFLLMFVIGLGFFLTPALLGGPSDLTVAMYIEQQVQIDDWGLASAMGVCLLAVTIIAYVIFDRLFGAERIVTKSDGNAAVNSETSKGQWTSRGVRGVLGTWTAVVLGGLTLPLIYVVVVSFSSKSYLTFPPSAFSTKWYHALFSDPSWKSSIWLSVRVALLTTVLATVLGLLTATAMSRSSRIDNRLLRAVFLLPAIIPVVLLAAGIYDLVLRTNTSGQLMAFALPHTLLALPFTTIIIKGSMRQVGSSYETAARTLGASPFAAFRKITLPLIAPSLVAAAAIAFVTSWDEVVIAMLVRFLQPTLPVMLFTTVQQSFTPVVAAVSSLILAAFALLAGVFVAGRWAWRRFVTRADALPTSLSNQSVQGALR
jgi:putative spermidine/putrescine transport system permease protein